MSRRSLAFFLTILATLLQLHPNWRFSKSSTSIADSDLRLRINRLRDALPVVAEAGKGGILVRQQARKNDILPVNLSPMAGYPVPHHRPNLRREEIKLLYVRHLNSVAAGSGKTSCDRFKYHCRSIDHFRCAILRTAGRASLQPANTAISRPHFRRSRVFTSMTKQRPLLAPSPKSRNGMSGGRRQRQHRNR